MAILKRNPNGVHLLVTMGATHGRRRSLCITTYLTLDPSPRGGEGGLED